MTQDLTVKVQKPPTTPPASNIYPTDDAMPDAIKILGDVWKNEESRFSNLNTRAIAVVSATSIITSVAGFYTKNLFDESLGESKTTALWGTTLSLVLLVATAGIITIGVLRPSRRAVFGNNALTKRETQLDKTGLNKIIFDELLGLYTILVARNKGKSFWLRFGYFSLLLAIVSIAVTTIMVVNRWYF